MSVCSKNGEECSKSRLWEQLGSAMPGALLASVKDQQLAQGLAVIPDWLLCYDDN